MLLKFPHFYFGSGTACCVDIGNDIYSPIRRVSQCCLQRKCSEYPCALFIALLMQSKYTCSSSLGGSTVSYIYLKQTWIQFGSSGQRAGAWHCLGPYRTSRRHNARCVAQQRYRADNNASASNTGVTGNDEQSKSTRRRCNATI